MTKEELISWLEAQGYKKDSWGNYLKEKDSKYRFKLSSHSVRLEKFHRDSYDNKKIWHRLQGNYYSNLSITEEGKLKGMKYGSLGLKPKF